MKPHLLSLLILLAASFPAPAQPPTLEQKASRSFGEHDWPSAQALYTVVLSKNPTDTLAAARSAVASFVTGDTVLALETFQNAMTHGVSLDAILEQIRSQSFRAGESDVYVNFMLTAARKLPWLARGINARLLPYYEFRDNGPKIVDYSQRMLAGLPHSIRYLSALARGYMLAGDLPAAAETWKEIINLEPNNFNSLVNLGFYYLDNNQPRQARAFIERAVKVNPTPYLKSTLANISTP